MTDALPKLYSQKRTASYFGVALQTVRRWCRKGTLPSFKVGKHVRITESAILKLVRTRGPDGNDVVVVDGVVMGTVDSDSEGGTSDESLG